MGITKVVVLIALIWLAYLAYRFFQRQQQQRKLAKTSRQLSADLVKCASCGVHLPKGEAVAENGRFYCPPGNRDCRH